MRNQTFAEFHRIARRQMRPFGTAKPREIGKIRVINSGRTGHFQKRIPGFFSRRDLIFELFQATGVWKANENNLSTARSDFFHGRGHVSKTLLDSFSQLLEENVLRDVSGGAGGVNSGIQISWIRFANSLPGSAHSSHIRARRSRSSV